MTKVFLILFALMKDGTFVQHTYGDDSLDACVEHKAQALLEAKGSPEVQDAVGVCVSALFQPGTPS